MKIARFVKDIDTVIIQEVKQSYYAAVPCLEALSLFGALGMLFCFCYLQFCAPSFIYSLFYYFVMSIPNMLIFIDSLLCLQRLLIFLELAPAFCSKFKL
ncbi:unnamed protein product [Caenorhabditis auriculariae]|uniref:Uncharacterized protein n=1 Tax=Caenorhabditis auriculariae TaxID=2777116 RepID=A0A8S1HW47_9PELO|nr:unnamed protein product [Caenorhabditis auriculariae]